MGVVLETRKLTKRFPGTIASNEIDFDVRSGEVHAIMGENGAGKSTICKMLTGLYQPDSGEIYFMLIGLTQQGTRYRDGSGETRKELIGKLPAIIAEAKFIQIGLKILNPTMVGANQKRFQITDRDMNPLEIIIFRTVSFCTESTSFQTLITGKSITFYN